MDKIRQRVKNFALISLFGAYFAKKTSDTIAEVPLTEDLNRLRMGLSIRSDVEVTVTNLASQHLFFHWHLAFAEIMKRGGFDVVFANPPWERIKLQEQEFFASRSQEIADAPNKAVRDRLIRQLVRDEARPAEKILFTEFESTKHKSEATSLFVRSGG